METLIAEVGFPIAMCLGVALFFKAVITQIVDQFIQTNRELLTTNRMLVSSIVPKVDSLDGKMDYIIDEIKKGSVTNE